MDYKNLLNENQYKAVSTNKQYVRIVAGAGSGKTRVLTYRLSYLISNYHADPYSIIAIAFTNKVAQEMKTRALKLLDGYAPGLTVSTFHSFCARFLRSEISSLNFPSNFTILDEEDSETLIKNIGVDLGYKKNDDFVKYAISFIGNSKCKGLYPDDIPLRSLYSEREKIALKIFKLYEEKKDATLCLDFDDLLLKTILILKEYQNIRNKWQSRIKHILVDEFQDTNDVQYKLIKLLMNEDTSLYVVGDPDQTIYTWRGANQDIILNFVRDFPSAETIILDRNYRSTKTILDCSNKLIQNNKKRVAKNLYTENNPGDKITVKSFLNPQKEAEYVVKEIEKLHHKENVEYRDIAILYRAAYLTLPFEHQFVINDIPYRIYGGIKFFQRKEIKDVVAYFHLLYNAKDDVSFERIVNVPRRSFGSTSLAILKEEKDAAHLSYLEYIEQIDSFNTSLKRKNVDILSELTLKINQTKEKLEENLEAYPKILEDFITDIGYFKYLQLDEEDADDRVDNVKTLFENIANFCKENPTSTFDEYLQNIALQTSQDEIEDTDSVSLMTIHVAKGLEFKYVFVVSLTEGVFPSHRSLEDNGQNGLEEERRLCYVAFTRAKEKLYVTANTGYSYVLQSYSLLSRFIKEAGLEVAKSYFDQPIYQPKPKKIIFDDIVYKDDDYFNIKENDDFMFTSDVKKDEPETNGVDEWNIGDIAYHDVFGHGVVKDVTDGGTIIVVNFDNSGIKKILANHPKIHKEARRGGEA